MRLFEVSSAGFCLSLLLAVSVQQVAAQNASCVADASVRSCWGAINSTISRTASASKWCSTVLACPEPTTTTLEGTVSTTITLTVTELYTWEEATLVGTTTISFNVTETSTVWTPTVTAKPTWTIERFEVTTVKSKKRYAPVTTDAALLPRATTSVCPSQLQQRACSCFYSCPGPVTRDRQRTIKSTETYTTYDIVTTSWYSYYDEIYAPTYFTETEYSTLTTTKQEFATRTRTLKCTPSISNPSFYLSATGLNRPSAPTDLPYLNKYVQAEPNFIHYREEGALFVPRYTRYKDAASVFELDEKGRLITKTSYGDHFAATGDYFELELFYFLSRSWVQARSWQDYMTCELRPPSGAFAGNLQELYCIGGYWKLDKLQWCPLYVEYYNMGTVVSNEHRVEFPTCYNVTYLVVPVCGGS